MRLKLLPVAALLLALSCVTGTAQTPDSELEAVITKFWTSLGVLDPNAMGQTLSWPVTIVETSSKLTKNPRVLTSWKDLEKDFRHSRPASGKSEFYGTKLGEFKVQMINESLALVTYVCTLPDVPYQADSNLFNAMTVLRKNPNEREPWKIIFITVPQ
jgi:hypothetical protein